MSLSTTVVRPCPGCGHPIETVLHQSYVIEDDASLKALLENRFHVLDCSQCGERRAFEADFLVTNKPRSMFVQVILRDEDVPKMIASMKSMLGDADVHARIVQNRADLVEKVKLRTLGLDDVAIEVMKHFARVQIGDMEGKTQRAFDRIEGEEMVFRVRVPGQPIQWVKQPVLVYHNIVRDLQTAAHARELEVDERLARRLLEERRAQKGSAPSAPPQAAAAAPVPAPAPAAAPAPAPAAAVVAVAVAAAAAAAASVSGAPTRRQLKVTHAGTDRRGRRFVSDGKIILLGDFVIPSDATTPALLTTETVEGFLDRKPGVWTPIAELTKSKLHAACYRTADDIALGEPYVLLLLGLGKPLDLGTTERLGPVLLRDGSEIVGTLMPLNLPPEKPTSPSASPVDDGAELRAPCPICKGSIPVGDKFCEACGVGLGWKADGGVEPVYPDLSPGRVIVSESFEMRPFPGRTALHEAISGMLEARPVHGGKMATFHASVTQTYVDYARPLGDACVRATFTPLDAGVRIGLCARHSIVGGIQIYYLFDVMPVAGRAWCSRGVQTTKQATSTRLCPEAKIPPVAPGVPIELELRVAGPSLRAFVNGQPVLSAHDAAFGSGSFGVRLSREPEVQLPVRVICHGYEIKEVLP